MDSVDFSTTSTISAKSRRSGKSLAERIRELGFHIRNERKSPQYRTTQIIEIKIEDNRPSDVLIMMPALNLEQITYYQPEVLAKTSSGMNLYEIKKFHTKSKGPKEIKGISDIEVKSYKPFKGFKFRRKKRRSTTISRIEEILNKGKGPLPLRDPSEESIVHPTQAQRQKGIKDLPESVLHKIFFYMSQNERSAVLSRVCKLWYYMLKDPIFWTELKFEGINLSSETIIQLIKTYPTVKKIQLISVVNAAEILQELCRCNHSITELGVWRCLMSSHDFVRIFLHVISCCTKLEVIDIRGMQFQSERVYLELGRLPNLKKINLSGNKFLKGKNLVTLSLNCRWLTDLNLLDTSSDNGTGLLLKDDDFILTISQLERNLQVLKIDMQQLGNVSYQAILRCSLLKNLVLMNCLNLSNEVFRKFPVLSKLKKLTLTKGANIKSADFQYVFGCDGLRGIEELDIDGCWAVGERGLDAITWSQGRLSSLSLKNCRSLKDTSLTYLSRCPHLADLNIAHSEIDPHELLSLHQNAKNLQSLVLDSNQSKKFGIRHLRKYFPSLIIKISFSEFQKDERILIDL